MLNEPTNEKLKAMRLEGMMAAWREQRGQPQIASLSFDERLGLHRRCRVDGSRELAHRARVARGEAEDGAGVRRGHRPSGEAGARQGRRAPARERPPGARAPADLDHRCDGSRQELYGVRLSAASLPNGSSCNLQASAPPLRGARARMGHMRSRSPTSPASTCWSSTSRSPRSPICSGPI